MSYESAKLALDRAQARLNAWDKKLRDRRAFQPVIKCEWDRAFDARELAQERACRANPEQFALDYPQCRWLGVYLGLLEPLADV